MSGQHVAIALPLLLPIVTALASVVAGSRPPWQRVIGVSGALAHLLASLWLLTGILRHGVLVSAMGGWPAPFGIVLVADRLAAAMTVLAALVGLAGTWFARQGLPEGQLPRFTSLLHLMLAGCTGIFLTSDLFDLYVWLELLLVSSFGLMALEGRRRHLEATTKYLALNLLGSTLLLTGVALVYAVTGTLDITDVALRLADAPSHLVTALSLLVLVGLSVKSAVFPLFFWLPASYHVPPLAVSAVFGGLLTKVGVYGLLRLFTLVFVHETAATHGTLRVLGALTMVTGVLGAVAQYDLRRLLSFHVISQIGYMLMGLGLQTVTGVAAAIFFVLHIVVTKTALFFVAGVIERAGGSVDLRRLGGLAGARPALAALFLLPALSLAGIPPLSGFAGKLALVQAGLAAGRPVLVATAVAVSLLTLYSMAKIWTMAFWAPAPPPEGPPRAPRPLGSLAAPAVVLAALSVLMGLAAEPLLRYSADAAETLVERHAYFEAVLGGGR